MIHSGASGRERSLRSNLDPGQRPDVGRHRRHYRQPGGLIRRDPLPVWNQYDDWHHTTGANSTGTIAASGAVTLSGTNRPETQWLRGQRRSAGGRGHHLWRHVELG